MHRRNALRAAVALLIADWPIASSAQPPARPVEEAGLLVGFDSGGTLWLAMHNDSVTPAWHAPFLVVPRRDGYWQIGSTARCSLDIDSAHGGGGIGFTFAFREYWQDLGISRAGEASTVTLGGSDDCAAAEARIREVRAKQFQDALKEAKGDTSIVRPPPPGNDDIGLDCVQQTSTVTFASERAIAIESRYSQTEACAPGGYTTSLDNLVRGFASTTPISLYSVVSRRELASAPATSEGGCRFSDGDSTPNWLPRRSNGRWIVTTWSDGPNVCRGGEGAEYDFTLPQSFTGEPPLPIAWAALRRMYPSLRDASAAPSRAFIALVVADTIIVRRIERDRLGREIGRAQCPAAGTTPVMYRWATSVESAKWSRDLPRLAPPRMRIVVRPQ